MCASLVCLVSGVPLSSLNQNVNDIGLEQTPFTKE